MKPLLITYLLMLSVCFVAQNKTTDSIRQIITQTKNNSSKINSLNDLAYHFYLINLNDSAIFYSKKTIELASSISFKKALGRAYNTLGLASAELGNITEAKKAYIEAKASFQNTNLSNENTKELLINKDRFGHLSLSLGNNNDALQSFKEGLELAKGINNLQDMADFYLSISMVYGTQGNYAESLKNNLEGLKIHEKLGNEQGMAWSYNDIGDTYLLLGNTESAIEYFSKAYVIGKKNNLFTTASLACYNIGDVYYRKKTFSLALQYAEIALELAKKNNDFNEKGNATMLIGKIFRVEKKYDKAIEMQLESVSYYENDNSKLEAYEPLTEISKVYFEKNNHQQSIFYGEKALALAQKMNSPLAIKITSENLFNSYEQLGDFKKAYRVHLLYIASRDSLLNENNQKELLYQEYKKQALADSLKYDAEKKINTIENQSRLKSAQTRLIFVVAGLVIAIALGLFLLNRFRITQKQNVIIEIQKQSLEIQTKEIQDSILYSKEIQNIFLKSVVNNNAYFEEALLIYKPKDVVSGDFYWYKEISNNLFVVVGDCTGHGVPGAIISVLAIQSLEKIIHQITQPDELHLLNSFLKEEFDVYYKKENHVSIGLDFSVLCFNKNNKTLYLSGSGAAILLKSTNGKIITEQFDSINIGGNAPVIYNPKTVSYPFSELRSVFLYTDGVIDQRGGEKNRKFGTSQLKKLLENLNTKTTEETLAKIETTLEDWKGNNAQMDDITFLGLQINA